MTRKIIIKRIAYSIISIVALAVVIIYAWSTLIIDKTYNLPLAEIQIPSDSASITEGKRLMQIAHCSDCHGEHLTGTVFAKIDHVGVIIAPNLTKVIPTYSNAELERVIRHGVKKNGHSVYIMPAFMYYQMKTESIGKIIAYLRTLHSEPDTLKGAKTNFEFLGRLALIQKKFIPIANIVEHNSPKKYDHFDTTQVSFGKYLAMTSCTSCHGQDLKGVEGLGPNLIIADAYKKEDFFNLIRTGVALGGRKLDLMTKVTTNNLCHLNDHEIDCIYAYLKTKPTK
ncbi:MAG: cytochrome c [Ginsengibacter sp.]